MAALLFNVVCSLGLLFIITAWQARRVKPVFVPFATRSQNYPRSFAREAPLLSLLENGFAGCHRGYNLLQTVGHVATRGMLVIALCSAVMGFDIVAGFCWLSALTLVLYLLMVEFALALTRVLTAHAYRFIKH